MPLIPVFGRRKQKDQKFKVPFCQVRFYLTEGKKIPGVNSRACELRQT